MPAHASEEKTCHAATLSHTIRTDASQFITSSMKSADISLISIL